MSSTNYHIKQFNDACLAHYSYAILSEQEVALVDPARDPQPYYDWAEQHGARIVAVIETHPHADFVSAHTEIARSTGATIYVSKLVDAGYPHQAFDDGHVLDLGKVQLHAMNTPGHSPDSISILLTDQERQVALFSGDTLFVGDVGRPDLREKAGNITAKQEELARMMYHTVQQRLKPLEDQVVVYPAHGAGSLCGKSLSTEASTTIGNERLTNYAFRPMTEEAFVRELTSDQPHIPKYFGHSVGLNRNGAPDYQASIQAVHRGGKLSAEAAVALVDPKTLIIDARNEAAFKQGHLEGAINLQRGAKFDTWLGSIVGPQEAWILLAANEEDLEYLISRAAAIGYEAQLKAAYLYDGAGASKTLAYANIDQLQAHPENYTIVDVRSASEAEEGQLFRNALVIPLPELRERMAEIPTDKPIMVHCAAGYRSAAGSSIIRAGLGDATAIFDVSEAVKSLPVLR
jgi:glyoxylase-like metal-dependent hydrolase (beta-lactamase superfamily II)/rhodanese-related sulfurtransferase